jgi:hypothetical protein
MGRVEGHGYRGVPEKVLNQVPVLKTCHRRHV